eukprot:1433786-Amphidinium_carterae.1
MPLVFSDCEPRVESSGTEVHLMYDRGTWGNSPACHRCNPGLACKFCEIDVRGKAVKVLLWWSLQDKSALAKQNIGKSGQNDANLSIPYNGPICQSCFLSCSSSQAHEDLWKRRPPFIQYPLVDARVFLSARWIK